MPTESPWRQPLLVAVCILLTLAGCSSTRQIRIENLSEMEFEDVTFSKTSYGDLAPGEITDYKPVKLRFRYGVMRLTAEGHRVNAQSLNFGAKRFTHRVRVKNLAAGHLAVEVVRDD